MSMMDAVARKVTVIPVSPEYTQKDIRKKRLRVAPYCRVSTDSDEQLNSYEAQIEYYTSKIAENPEWSMVRLYADEGITGTSMRKRKEFLKLIEDCEKGKIDMVITKSVTRFARNTLEGIQTVRQLKRMGIGVFFEKENTNTLYLDNEMVLTFFFSQAQAESESLSGNVRWGHRKNFQDGKVYYQYKSFLGYRRGPDGQPEIDEEEAAIVRRIFSEFLMGNSLRKICHSLESDGIKTVRGRDTWSESTLKSMLRNEKYIGDALLQKTYIADLFTHQSKKNRGELPQYYVHDCHPAIIDRTTFQKVQEELARRASLHKRSTKAKTEQGKYSSQYALSDLLICGECGSSYRRHLYIINNERVRVWRCINRLENGKRYCKHSPTLREEDLHRALVNAMNDSTHLPSVKETLRDSIIRTLAGNEPSMTPQAVESQIRAIQERQVELYKLAATSGAGEEYDEELGHLHSEKIRLLELMDKLTEGRNENQAFENRLSAVDTLLDSKDRAISEYDDCFIRSLISFITVQGKETIIIHYKDGSSVIQTITKPC
jgi:DNA invertase Pin-like site-specific DNA recombinase